MKTSQLVAAALVAISAVAFAQTAIAPPKQIPPLEASALTAGEVRKVDKEAAKITIRHEPLVNLDMPAMTMVFRVADPKFLDAVKQGDKVKFAADKVGGQYVVTRIEAAK